MGKANQTCVVETYASVIPSAGVLVLHSMHFLPPSHLPSKLLFTLQKPWQSELLPLHKFWVFHVFLAP